MLKTISSKANTVVEVVRWTIVGIVGLIALMWAINVWVNPAANVFFGILGFFAALFVAIKPKVVVSSLALSGFMGFLNGAHVGRSAIQGPVWLYRVVRVLVYGFLLCAVVLSTWSFAESPFSFWGLFLVVIALLTWREVYNQGAAWWKWVEWAYLSVCALVLVFSTLGPTWQGHAFDPCTGQSLHLVDPSTGSIHKTLPVTTCPDPQFSAETGEKLVPMNKQQALTRNVTAWLGTGIEAVDAPWWAIPAGITAVIVLVLMYGSRVGGGVRKALIALGLLSGVYLAYQQFSNPASAGFSCSKERVMVKPGMIFAVPRDCPVYVNQVHMKESGFRFDLVDTDLQKVAVNEEFIAFSQKFRGAESEHDGKLVPQRSMYDLHGRTELFVVISVPKTVRAPL